MGKELKYYIYFHINPLKNEIFYVGKGYGNRSHSKHSRNKFWNHTINKYKTFCVDIIENGLSENEAYKREKYWIDRIGRRDLGKGTLVNMTNGGEGTSGYKVSGETKKKMSLSTIKKYKNNKDIAKKISKTLKDKKINCKKINMLDLDGKILKTFDSITQASNEMGFNSRAINNCLKGRTKKSSGYKWEYKI